MAAVQSGEGYEIIEQEGEYLYKVTIPELSPAEKAFMSETIERAIKEINIAPASATEATAKKEKLIEALVKLMTETLKFKGAKGASVSPDKLEFMAKSIADDMIGYGKIQPLLNDDNLEEVMVIGINAPVYVAHRKLGAVETNIVFEEDDGIQRIIEKIGRFSGRKIDLANPLLDARLPDGSRVNATLRPASLDGSTITIRKFKAEALTVVDIIKFNTFGSDLGAFLWLAVHGLGVKPSNVLVSGGTGSGKTTTLNCLGMFIPKKDRVITIEDTAELQLPLKHRVRLETKPPNVEGKGGLSFNQLLINTLRMRPDRLILGEVRGEEATTLFVAMNTGHDGCMGTVHANSADETISRLINPPMNVPLIMVPAVNLILMQNRIAVGGKPRRRVTEVAEVAGLEVDKVLLNRVFTHDPKTDKVKPTGTPSRLIAEIAEKAGLKPADVIKEIEQRAIVLDYLAQKDIHKLADVYQWIQAYYKNSENVLDKIGAGATTLD